MDLLLQAAQVLEQENSGHGADPESATRGAYFSQNIASISESSDRLEGSQTYSDNGNSAEEEDIPSQERTSRRVGGIGTREVHNQLEKNRRRQLREFFNQLQQVIPSLENKRVATQSILQGAIKHIKNLKKKDVEQEREIQMLAKRKSELKKKLDLELNRCTEEQQHTAQLWLSMMRSKYDTVPVEQDGHSSDSTSTASEGPSNDDFSDGEMDTFQLPLRQAMSPGSSDGRKRKLLPAADPGQGVRVSEPAVGNPRTVVCTSSQVSSTVSSSSVALKHMLEQRKRNQTTAGQASASQQSSDNASCRGQLTAASSSVGVNISAMTTKVPGSLTYSYPIITTHLASAVKPPMSLACPVQSSQPTLQSSLVAPNRVLVSHTMPGTSSVLSSQNEVSVPSMMCPMTTDAGTRKNRQINHGRVRDDISNPQQSITAHHSSLSSHNVNFITAGKINSSPVHFLSDSSLKVTSGSAYLQASLVQPQPVLIKTPENRRLDTSPTSAQKIASSHARLDLSNFSYLDKTVAGGHTGSLTLESAASAVQPLNVNMTSSKMVPTVIPLSLASIMRGLPVNAGLPQMVSLASTPLGFPSSANSQPITSHTEMSGSAILNNKLQITPNTNYLLTAMPVTSQPNSLSLSTNNARITTLLSAPSSHVNKSITTSNNSNIKPNSPITSSTSTICSPSSIAIPVTLTSTLVPLSLNNGQIATNPSSALTSGTPLRIFTSLSQTPMMATSLTNGQSSLIPTVVQLETSGQVALLQNLIPGQHVQVQNSHHILAQPFVVMATANSNFNSTNTATTTS